MTRMRRGSDVFRSRRCRSLAYRSPMSIARRELLMDERRPVRDLSERKPGLLPETTASQVCRAKSLVPVIGRLGSRTTLVATLPSLSSLHLLLVSSNIICTRTPLLTFWPFCLWSTAPSIYQFCFRAQILSIYHFGTLVYLSVLLPSSRVFSCSDLPYHRISYI